MSQPELFKTHGTELHDEFHCDWLLEVQPVIDIKVRGLCSKPYDWHPKGCPNFNKCDRCPPMAPIWQDIYDITEPTYAVIHKYDLEDHVWRMQEKHPNWSMRQCRCVLYWQPTAREYHRELIEDAMLDFRCQGYKAETTPEAMGINVTQTLDNVGITLEWPPTQIAMQVALLGKPNKVKP